MNAAIATGCFAAMSRSELKALLATARASALPALTQASLNAYINSIPQARLASESNTALANLYGYLSAHFTLSPQQQQEIRAMSPAQITQIKGVVNSAVTHKTKPTVSLPVLKAVPREKTTGVTTKTETHWEFSFIPPKIEKTQTTTTTANTGGD